MDTVSALSGILGEGESEAFVLYQESGAISLGQKTRLTFGRIPSKSGIVPLSGKQMVDLYQKAGWKILRQKGSHVQMGNGDQRETIPMHRELKKGLEQKLLKRLRASEA